MRSSPEIEALQQEIYQQTGLYLDRDDPALIYFMLLRKEQDRLKEAVDDSIGAARDRYAEIAEQWNAQMARAFDEQEQSSEDAVVKLSATLKKLFVKDLKAVQQSMIEDLLKQVVIPWRKQISTQIKILWVVITIFSAATLVQSLRACGFWP